jgi:hypothetical protein
MSDTHVKVLPGGGVPKAGDAIISAAEEGETIRGEDEAVDHLFMRYVSTVFRRWF